MNKYVLSFLIVTPVLWLAGSYIVLDWLWFIHATDGARAGYLICYTIVYFAFVTCPMIFPWRGDYDY